METYTVPQTAPRAPRSTRKREKPKLPIWLIVIDFMLVLALLGVLISSGMMRSYLSAQEQARQDAHAQILREHPRRYLDAINQVSETYNIKPAFLLAIILNESSFQTDAVSSVGARGLMQVMEGTAGWIADKLDFQNYSFDRLFESETNLLFGTWYIRYLADMFRGDPVLVACAYHAGQGTVTQWLNNAEYSTDGKTIQLDKLMDGPTKSYARRVTLSYAIYEQLYYVQHTEDAQD